MATLTIRGLPEETKRALKARAASNDRSMEAEVRAILQSAVEPRDDFVMRWLEQTATLRGEFSPPDRSYAREIDLS